MGLTDEDAEHEHWLAETWDMIAHCAISLNPRKRVSLSTAGCAALIAERRAQIAQQEADRTSAPRVAERRIALDLLCTQIADLLNRTDWSTGERDFLEKARRNVRAARYHLFLFGDDRTPDQPEQNDSMWPPDPTVCRQPATLSRPHLTREIIAALSTTDTLV